MGEYMQAEKICRTIHQYCKYPVSEQDMQKLLEVAKDYRKVKNYVYARYGGIGSLPKLYPGYTIQNEMTASGLRQELGLPAVYFYLAIFDALGDIKSQWTKTKGKIQGLVRQNGGFNEEERHYLRFLLRVSNAFTAVLEQQPVELAAKLQGQYAGLASQVDTGKLHRYLCRQVRRHHKRLHTDQASGFALSGHAYRYADHGIYISIKERRRRVFVPLTDNNQYKCQAYLKLYPEEGRVVLDVPVYMAVRSHRDYQGMVGIALGVYTMLTTDGGHCYGEELGEYQIPYADWVREQTRSYNRNRGDNPGRKKYHAKKRRLEGQLHGYINQELNRFLKEEKPQAIYMAKLPKSPAGGVNPRINHSVSQWQRGYIRERLRQKCREQSVEVIEVFGKDISRECSSCGAIGRKSNGEFSCPACGCHTEEKANTARNAKRRGQEMA